MPTLLATPELSQALQRVAELEAEVRELRTTTTNGNGSHAAAPTLQTMRSSRPRLYTSLMPIVPDLLAPANGWLSSMPKTRWPDAVVVASEGGLGYRARSREYDRRDGG